MNRLSFDFHGAALEALPSGALNWPVQRLLVVSDLHLGKSARLSAVGGAALPPYDTRETLARLKRDIEATDPAEVICLGDSFDTARIGALLPEDERALIEDLQQGRGWTWIEGNHDRGPTSLPGTHAAETVRGPLTFRHVATRGAQGEVSGHYHPKARIPLRGRLLSRPCFLLDAVRMILPAYGAYTGGLRTDSPTLDALMGPGAQAILCGPRPACLPMPRGPAKMRAGGSA